MRAPDDFDERHRLAMAELAASDLRAGNYDPPLHRALRRLGVKLRPPHYQAPAVNAAVFGAPFAVLLGVVFWLLPGLPGGAPGGLIALLAGAAFGWLMARSCRRDAEAAGLTPWEALSPDGPAS